MPRALYKKLNLSQENFKQLLITEYRVNKLSQAQIANKINCHVTTVEQWFKKFKIKPRTQSKALANRWKKCTPLTQNEKEQMFGWLLSDGTLEASEYSARFTIGLKHKSVLHKIRRTLPSLEFTPIWTSQNTKCSHMKSHSYYELKTIYKQWYYDGTKRLPKNLSLTPETVYYWFIGDGSRVPYGIQLSTECFTALEVKRLSRLLKDLKFDNTILKSNRIRIKSASIVTFYEYIGECRHDIYQYKWRLDG